MKFTKPAFTLSNVATAIASIGTFLLIAGLVPLTENFVDESKLYGLFLIALIMGILFAIAVIRRGAIELVLSKVTFLVVGFTIAIAASTFFTNPYPVKAVLNFGGAFLAAGAIVLFASPLFSKASKKVWLWSLSLGASVVVIASYLELAGVGLSSLLQVFGPFSPPPQAVLFNLSGSIASGLQVALVGVVGIVATWFANKRAKPLQVVAAVILLMGVLLYGYFLIPGRSVFQMPSMGAGWSIALDTVRDPRGALIGAGTGAYQDTYQRYKPYWMNGTDQWWLIFSNASSTPLTLLTLTGFIGLFSWLAIVIVSALDARKAPREEMPVSAMLFTTFLIQLFFPPNYLLIGIQAFLLALFIAGRRQELGVLHFNFFHAKIHTNKVSLPGKQTQPRWPLYITSLLILALIGFSAYWLSRFYMASYYSLLAAKATVARDLVAVYDNQQKAIGSNPYLDVYRRRYALTSLAIAEILAEKTDKTTQDSEQIAQLIQQAVREAQAGIALDQADAQNHLVAANIYQRLIGGIDGAETFAEQYYVQAINLFPTNPDTYISLAGIYLKQQQFQRALGVLNQGLSVKSDYANTHFNLGFTLEQLKAYPEAKTAYERARSLLTDTTSNDYTQLTQKIDELGKIVDEAEKANKAAAEKNGQTEKDQQQDGNPSAVELNLNNDQQLQPNENVQVDQGNLPAVAPQPSTQPAEAQPAVSPAASPAPTASPTPQP